MIRQFLVLFILLLSPAAISAQKIIGTVSQVKDGDSFVMISNGKFVEVRLDGIDCPEKGQPFSAKAKQFTSSQILNKSITVQIKGYDKYKRALGIVYLTGNRILNEELLKVGMAWHYKKYNNDVKWAKLENAARKSNRGLWDDPDPFPPWEYRQYQRQKNKHNPK